MLTGERDARFAPARDFLGMAFGVGGREFAAGVAGTGDEAGTNGVRLDGQTESFDLLPGGRETFGRNAGDQQVLPNGEPEIAIAEVPRDGGQTAHLRDRHASYRKGDADPVPA